MTPAELEDHIRKSIQQKSAVMVSSNGLDIAFQTKILAYQSNEIYLENMVGPDFIKKFMGGSQFFIQIKMLRLQSSKIQASGPNMVFHLNENSVIEETRNSERFSFSPEERVVAEFLNPYDKKTVIHRPVLDMSASGLSIRMNVATALFKPQSVFEDIKVTIDGKPYTKTSGEVVYNRKFMDLKGKLRVQVGLKYKTQP
jgi:hypothetical protein